MKRGIKLKIFLLLKEKNTPLRVVDIANYLSINYYSVYKAIKSLEHEGYIRKINNKTYELTKKIIEI